MRKEAKLLLGKAQESLILCVEHFNRPSNVGRTEAVLHFLDHAFEMLLKAAIVHKGGKIREPKAEQTIGFDHCVRKGLSEGNIRFLTEEQALTLQVINAQRDAAQHYLIEVPEEQLYLNAQAGVTLFDDILRSAFGESLAGYLPSRVLPISTNPPRNLTLMIADEVAAIRKLLAPGTRRRMEARLRLTSLAVLEAAIQGERIQPGGPQMDRLLRRLGTRESWEAIFPGVAALEIDTSGKGIPFSLRITKKEGIPIQVVPDGDEANRVVAIKRVNELDFYNLGLRELSQKVGLTPPKTRAVLWHLGLWDSPDYYKEIVIGTQKHKRYSQKAIATIQSELNGLNIDELWRKFNAEQRRRP